MSSAQVDWKVIDDDDDERGDIEHTYSGAVGGWERLEMVEVLFVDSYLIHRLLCERTFALNF